MDIETPSQLMHGIVDAHHHFWDLQAVHYPWVMAKGEKRFFGDPTPIQKDYLSIDFRIDWNGLPVSQSVHVQVGVGIGEEIAESEALSTMNHASGLPNAIIAFCDLTAPDRDAILEAQADILLVRGIRQIIGRHPVEDSRNGSPMLLDNPRFLAGLRRVAAHGLSFDLQVTDELLARANRLFAEVPELKVVLCHVGSPWDQSTEGLTRWRRNLENFAALPNSYVKLSGISMFDPRWARPEFHHIVRAAFETFGPERSMWGSNFPVDKLHRPYREIFETTWDAIPPLHRAAVFADTARHVYRLPLPDGIQVD